MDESEGEDADSRDGMGAVLWMVLSCLLLVAGVLALMILGR